MLKFYYSGAPNPTKVALFLEESGLPYEPIPVDTRKGDQHKPEYLAINPNAKVPAIVDGDAVVFDSNAILLYLAKTGKFLPEQTSKARGELLSWLMFVASGVGPYSGQSVHFRNYAPEKLPYAINRYAFEAQRHFGISMYASPNGVTCWVTLTPSWTWTFGAGRVSSRTLWARAHGTNLRILSGLSMRSAHDRRPSELSRLRTNTSSRRRWTVRRSTRCSPT